MSSPSHHPPLSFLRMLMMSPSLKLNSSYRTNNDNSKFAASGIPLNPLGKRRAPCSEASEGLPLAVARQATCGRRHPHSASLAAAVVAEAAGIAAAGVADTAVAVAVDIAAAAVASAFAVAVAVVVVASAFVVVAAAFAAVAFSVAVVAAAAFLLPFLLSFLLLMRTRLLLPRVSSRVAWCRCRAACQISLQCGSGTLLQAFP